MQKINFAYILCPVWMLAVRHVNAPSTMCNELQNLLGRFQQTRRTNHTDYFARYGMQPGYPARWPLVARAGRSTDGHIFIPAAIAAGAAAIVGEKDQPELSVPYVRVRDSQAVLGLLAAAFHDFPSRKLLVIGVTGTDGKTTTATSCTAFCRKLRVSKRAT